MWGLVILRTIVLQLPLSLPVLALAGFLSVHTEPGSLRAPFAAGGLSELLQPARLEPDSLEADLLQPEPDAPDCAWSWPDGRLSGWYAGVGAGLAYTDAADEVAGDALSGIGFNNASTDLDESAWAGKVFVGYRFERPLSLEAGWVDLGEVDGDFKIPPPPPGVGGSFSREASGFFASAAWHFEESELWSFSGKVGGFLWDSDTTLSSPGLPPNQRHTSDNGFNPFFGLTAMRTLSERVGARIEYDRFYLDSDPTDLLSLGLFVKF